MSAPYTGGPVVAFLSSDGVNAATVSPGAPLPVSTVGPGATTGPITVVPGTANNFAGYSTITYEVDSLSVGGSVTFAGGTTQAIAQAGTYPLQVIVNASTGTQVTSITASGIYRILFAGGLWINATLTGTGTITAEAS